MDANAEMIAALENQSAGADSPAGTLVTASVEKNSRGWTWKVEVGATGVDPVAAIEALDWMVHEMGSRFGVPTAGGKE